MKHAQNSKSGFTLVEVMIAAALAAIAMSLVMTVFLTIAHTADSVTRYRRMHEDLRHAMMALGRDFTATKNIPASGQDSIDLDISRGGGTVRVRYTLANGVLMRRQGMAPAEEILTGVSDSELEFFMQPGVPTTYTSARYVWVSLTVTNSGVRNVYEDELSGHFFIRNRVF